MIYRFIVLLVLAQPVVGLMCYFCADTSNLEGRNKCQTYLRTMRYYGRKAMEKGVYKTDKYVKNCTGYGDPGNVYCMVASVEARNNVRSFIRDCSDGTSFFSEDINSQFEKDMIIPNNQTTCKYTGQGYLACVTLCGGDEFSYGHFCNGPELISSATTTRASLILLLAILKIAMLR